ncbi:MAG: kinetochore-associated Ndc80 complex subunit spc24 [Trizodia sp. TS-e1964]|nr:MAG: kinetochore-associated Ndc80 complex subunit spc24 [Trizodia sp. TS-e1964]
MLLDEDPADLLRHTVQNLNIDPDKSALERINYSLGRLGTIRDRQLYDAHSALKKLSRTLSALSTQHEDARSSHSSSEHATRILALDKQKFRIAKAASELEVESERLEQELDGLKARLHELEAQGLEGSDNERGLREMGDETLLKLKVYRSLGIEIEADSTGNYTKAAIRNNQKGDVSVVNIDPKFSRFFYANYFWQTL